ncbi:metallophosphoesterase family protein [Chryseobacterium caseinilyticum]|uniref:Metallophosphoesterase n=1 Tax=Chryseobacterium caseinilyticum TaxID=2771428 RepID=A0ABR8Z6B6_9FLAO|nr:metallophosphoesterase [Chryseobacterium caseinilyticum]MBD8080829.1 metallophosphoesterase [Chryseobacterium caseinilyticum]
MNLITILVFITAFVVVMLIIIKIWEAKFFKPKQIQISLYKDELDEMMTKPERKIKSIYYFIPRKSVEWFNLPGLLNTFKRVSLSTDTLSIIDKREVQDSFGKDFSEVPFQRQSENKSNGEKAFWFDFTADTGDSFDSTMNVFYPLTRDRISYQYGKDFIELDRADMLVLGGDLVYPDATESNYIDRFKGPIRLLFPGENKNLREEGERFAKNNTLLVATPGNHDWYDGLNAFFRMMCQQKKIGYYQTIQQRSYFAYKLTDKVHILGIDNQLMGDVDIPQLEYFVTYVAELSQKLKKAKSKLKQYFILLIAEPNWYGYVAEDRGKRRQRMDSLEYFIMEIKKTAKYSHVLKENPDFQIEFKMILCGDIHHYAHYEFFPESDEEKIDIQHLVTSGGGGAFGHFTDFLENKIKIPDFTTRFGDFVNYKLKKTYPSVENSKKLNHYNLLFPFYNIWFTVMLIVIAFISSYIYVHNDGFFLRSLALLIIPVIVTFIVYKVASPERSRKELWTDIFLYIVMFLSSLCLQFLIMRDLYDSMTIRDFRIGTFLCNINEFLFNHFKIDEIKANEFFNFNEKRTVVFFCLGILQSFFFGFYLWFSYRFFGKHVTEASSSKVQKDKRNFLKFKITDSQITVYSIGIEKCYPWKSLLKGKKAVDLQKEIYKSQENPDAFLKEKFGDMYDKSDYKIIDEFSIDLN